MQNRDCEYTVSSQHQLLICLCTTDDDHSALVLKHGNGGNCSERDGADEGCSPNAKVEHFSEVRLPIRRDSGVVQRYVVGKLQYPPPDHRFA